MKLTDPTGMDWYEDEDGHKIWMRNQTSSTYKDDNGKAWTRTGESATFVFKDQVVIFGQDVDKDGNQTLSSKTINMSPEAEQQEKNTEMESYEVHFALAGALMKAPFQSSNSPIPGKDDAMMWTMAAAATLYGVADYGVSLFSKKARGNHNDDGLLGVDIGAELESLRLKGRLTEAEKAYKRGLVTQEKVNNTCNKQKKSGERGTGTGRR